MPWPSFSTPCCLLPIPCLVLPCQSAHAALETHPDLRRNPLQRLADPAQSPHRPGHARPRHPAHHGRKRSPPGLRPHRHRTPRPRPGRHLLPHHPPPSASPRRYALDLKTPQQTATHTLRTHDFTSFAANDPDQTTRSENSSNTGSFSTPYALLPTPCPIRTIDHSAWHQQDDLLI